MSHLFVALPLPAIVRTHLQARSRAIQDRWAFHKWSHPEDYHLTLFFLGNVTEEQQHQVTLGLKQVVAQPEIGSFRLSINRWGIFGHEAQPRVLWAGVQGELQHLFALQHAVQAAMHEIGFPIEKRPYRPHITIAKRAQQPGFSLAQLQNQHPMEEDAWNVQNMVLYRTRLSYQPHYQEVIQFSFKKSKLTRS